MDKSSLLMSEDGVDGITTLKDSQLTMELETGGMRVMVLALLHDVWGLV